MDSLFTIKSNFRIVRITDTDARWKTDHLQLFEDLISTNEIMYPGIKSWLNNKVLPDLKASSRTGFIGYDGENPIITAVVKKGERSKFCHLRIAEDFQDINLGEIFFTLMALEVRREAKEVHFTLPESLWSKRRAFFESFGFKEAKKSHIQYRLFEEELRCSSPFTQVWRGVLDKLPKLTQKFSINNYSMRPRLLLSMRPEHADKVLNGHKTIEIRRRFTSRWSGEKVALYSSGPVKALVGQALIKEVKSAPPVDIWESYGPQIGCSEAEFFSYAHSCREVYALLLQDVIPYAERIPLSQVEALIQEDLVPPQSYCELEKNRPWAKALSIAALLHGSLKARGIIDSNGMIRL